ncbi:hypothetical protein HDU92_006741 [Lobulomyces angularis]|nr:hypothetical protein HDU92_006741 [Lobulomyces angularis]
MQYLALQAGPTQFRPPSIVNPNEVNPNQRITNSNTPDDNDKTTLVFISNLPDGTEDKFIETLLLICGNVKTWRRVKDPYGNLKNFGFCVFSDAIGVLQALKFLGGDGKKNRGLLIYSSKSGAEPKRLKLTIDDPTKKYIEIFKRTMNNDPEEIEEMQIKIDAHLETLKPSEKAAENLLASLSSENAATSPRDATENGVEKKNEGIAAPPVIPSKPIDQMEHAEILLQEIHFFRNQSAKYDQNKKEKDLNERKMMEQRQIERENRQHANGRRDSSAKHEKEEDDGYNSEEERKKAERRKNELHEAFLEREAKFEHQENIRFKRLEQDEIRDREYLESRRSEREFWTKRLFEYDDDHEMELGRDDFFVDRQRWIRNRRQFRSKEIQLDERDRKAEAYQKQNLARQQEQLSRNNSGSNTPTSDYNNNLNNSRISLEEMEREREEAEQLELESTQKIEKIMTMEERQNAITNLVKDIPDKKDALFDFEVKWDYLNDNILYTTLRAFVGKKLVEYFGDEGDNDLCEYILRLIKRKHGAVQIYKGLNEAIQDPEASEEMVVKIWRRLVYETESRARGLS